MVIVCVVAVTLAMFPTPHYRTRQEHVPIIKYVTKDEFDRIVEEDRAKGFYVEIRVGEPPNETYSYLFPVRFPHIVGCEYKTVEYVVWLPWWIP